MGFAEDQSLAALQETANDLELAVDILMQGIVLQVPEKPKDKKQEDKSEEDINVFEKFEEYNIYGTFT